MESKLLSAVSIAENGKMLRFSALSALGLGRDKKYFSSLPKAINVLMEEGRVQKIGRGWGEHPQAEDSEHKD